MKIAILRTQSIRKSIITMYNTISANNTPEFFLPLNRLKTDSAKSCKMTNPTRHGANKTMANISETIS